MKIELKFKIKGQCASMLTDPDKQYTEFATLCNNVAKVMYETVKLFGCAAFEKSQTNSCLCNQEEIKEDADEKNIEYEDEEARK